MIIVNKGSTFQPIEYGFLEIINIKAVSSGVEVVDLYYQTVLL